MIKTLRITTIFVAVLAVVFFVFLVIFGFRSNREIEQFLSSPSAVEKFRQAKGTDLAKDSGQVPPLVKQAENFTKIINPPPELVRRPETPTIKPPIEHRPPATSAKFELIGTSVHESDPKKSMALIDLPGKGLRWIRQSAEVGHLVLEQINDGLVVVRDGQKTFELTPKREERRSLLKGPTSDKTDSIPLRPWDSKPALPPLGRTRAGITNIDSAAQTSEETLKEKMAIANLFKQLETGTESTDRTDSNSEDTEDAEDQAAKAILEKLLSDLKTTRVSSEEADKLGGLGEELEQIPEQLSDSNQTDKERLTTPIHPAKVSSRPAPKQDETRDEQRRRAETEAKKRRMLRRLKK